MKKRTLVCFLIFTLCVFYTAIPNTVFGQEEDASLAEQVLEKYGELLQRDGSRSSSAGFCFKGEGLKSQTQFKAYLGINPALISLVVQSPAILEHFRCEP